MRERLRYFVFDMVMLWGIVLTGLAGAHVIGLKISIPWTIGATLLVSIGIFTNTFRHV